LIQQVEDLDFIVALAELRERLKQDKDSGK